MGVAILALAACAQLPVPDASQRTPRTLSEFELDGRIVVRDDQNRHYANISWRHRLGQDAILVTTPLGQGVAELLRDPEGARLVTADGKTYAAADWAALFQQLFGVRLPLDELPAWLTGRAPPLTSAWRVEYLEYESDARDALPTLIQVSRGDQELRLKVSTWITAQ